VLGGELMLLQQGARAFELWTGKPAPVEVMQAELDRTREEGLRQIPVDMGPAGEVPAGEVPTGEVPTGEVPTGEVPAGEAVSAIGTGAEGAAAGPTA
jgi:hypothetical protein